MQLPAHHAARGDGIRAFEHFGRSIVAALSEQGVTFQCETLCGPQLFTLELTPDLRGFAETGRVQVEHPQSGSGIDTLNRPRS